MIGNPSIVQHSSCDFNVNFNKITTAFRYGVIDIQYLAFATDDRGYPLVPDDVSFRDALFWKIAYHVSMRKPELMANQRMQDMEYCRQMWNKYCVQARAEANMPDLDMLIRLKNNWLRLHNTMNDEVNDFKDLGHQQRINLDGRK